MQPASAESTVNGWRGPWEMLETWARALVETPDAFAEPEDEPPIQVAQIEIRGATGTGQGRLRYVSNTEEDVADDVLNNLRRRATEAFGDFDGANEITLKLSAHRRGLPGTSGTAPFLALRSSRAKRAFAFRRVGADILAGIPEDVHPRGVAQMLAPPRAPVNANGALVEQMNALMAEIPKPAVDGPMAPGERMFIYAMGENRALLGAAMAMMASQQQALHDALRTVTGDSRARTVAEGNTRTEIERVRLDVETTRAKGQKDLLDAELARARQDRLRERKRAQRAQEKARDAREAEAAERAARIADVQEAHKQARVAHRAATHQLVRVQTAAQAQAEKAAKAAQAAQEAAVAAVPARRTRKTGSNVEDAIMGDIQMAARMIAGKIAKDTLGIDLPLSSAPITANRRRRKRPAEDKADAPPAGLAASFLAGMSPEEAAEVLESLDDAQMQEILAAAIKRKPKRMERVIIGAAQAADAANGTQRTAAPADATYADDAAEAPDDDAAEEEEEEEEEEADDDEDDENDEDEDEDEDDENDEDESDENEEEEE